ncbi:MAG TPA: hypothetical protein VL974_07335 [Magnetospirillum sp.]|jgi:hypothetical protein|nr:hypothetical protein [Magnetospirillum sp.]
MSMEWTRRGDRRAMELSVGLEAAANLLMRAKSARQLDEAVSYNLRLWRTIRNLTEEKPYLVECELLAGTADHVAALLALDAHPCVDPRDLSFVAGRNLALAADLARPETVERSRDALVAEWAHSDARRGFELWLLEGLSGEIGDQPIL